MSRNRRLPAEWEPQDGVLLAWPHEATDWHPCLPEVEPVFAAIIAAVTRFETAVVAVPAGADIRGRLQAAGADLARVRPVDIPTNDTWARDFGPITVEEEGRPLVLDFGFNGWGLKFAADLDNRITRRLHEQGILRPRRATPGLILEGGSIESDGRGTILTTSECLLNDNRNPHLDRPAIEAALRAELGAERFLWLENGALAGDDTDSHVDTLARLCPDDTIVYQACDDESDDHYAPLARMADELKSFRTAEGKAYRLIPLPWPQPHYDDGDRLPATYANFLIVNGAVLVPTYGAPRDGEALAAIAVAFPGREVIDIPCAPLLLQHGSLHCVTMQLPTGVLR